MLMHRRQERAWFAVITAVNLALLPTVAVLTGAAAGFQLLQRKEVMKNPFISNWAPGVVRLAWVGPR